MLGPAQTQRLRAGDVKKTGRRCGNHSLRRAFLTMLADAGVEDSVRVVLAGHKAKTVTDRHYTARNLPRFVPAIAALRFERVTGLAGMMPDEDARAA
jgi:integrase